MAVSTALRLVVTSNRVDNTLALFDLDPAAGFPARGSLGAPGSGPLQFCMSDASGYSGWLCFTVPVDGRPTLLVADHGNDRVQEVGGRR